MNVTVYYISKNIDGSKNYLRGFNILGVAEYTYSLAKARRYPAQLKDIARYVARAERASVEEYIIETVEDIPTGEEQYAHHARMEGNEYLSGFDSYSGEHILSSKLEQAMLYPAEYESEADNHLDKYGFSKVLCVLKPISR